MRTPSSQYCCLFGGENICYPVQKISAVRSEQVSQSTPLTATGKVRKCENCSSSKSRSSSLGSLVSDSYKIRTTAVPLGRAFVVGIATPD
eukprot:2641821-Rhodomonas_salina.1